MYQLNILQNQWAILAITAGISLMLIVVISYVTIWHPRVDRKYWVTEKSSWREALGNIPWVLLFTYGGILVMTIVVMLYYARHPANW